MKKSLATIGMFLIIVIFGIIVIPKIISRWSEGAVVESNRSVPSMPLGYLNVNDTPRKVPEFLMRNQDSLLISNDDYLGKVYVVEFFFTRCPSICPIMNQNMKRLDSIFASQQDFGIASITIDPDFDTPRVLKEYANRYEVQSPNWHFLTAEKETVYSLANEGFNIFAAINPDIAGGFEHQGYFALIDKSGFLRSRTDVFGNPKVYYSGINGLNPDGSNDINLLIEDIEQLLKETP